MRSRPDRRSTDAAAYRKLYKTSRWQRLRERQLTAHPLCAYCMQQEDVTPATVCDHVRPHKGCEELFFDPDNLQSLCAPCHDRIKQREELGQDVVRFGPDGWPVS
ncbi:HNH endonuclease [Ochrobactrum sp. MYb49]|nr:HNH endonuclease [Ochrobactrum sp. MYb49]